MKMLRDIVDYYRLNRTFKEHGIFSEDEVLTLTNKGIEREKLLKFADLIKIIAK